MKITVIAADERYLPMDNGTLFSTGNHPVETLLPMYHLHRAGFGFDIATVSGMMTKFEYWAMPHQTKNCPLLRPVSDAVPQPEKAL